MKILKHYYAKLLLMALAGILGVYVASIIGPDAPIYSSVPSELERSLATFTEVAIGAVMGIFVALFVLPAAIALKMTMISAFYTALTIGALFSILDHLRIGTIRFSQNDLFSLFAFVCGLLTVFGILKIVDELRDDHGVD